MSGPACCPNCGHNFRGDGPIASAGLTIDLIRREVMWRGKPVHLYPREIDVLAVIVRAAGQPLKCDSIVASLGADIFGENIRLHVHRLRAKLPGIPIKTVTRHGYAWRP